MFGRYSFWLGHPTLDWTALVSTGSRHDNGELARCAVNDAVTACHRYRKYPVARGSCATAEGLNIIRSRAAYFQNLEDYLHRLSLLPSNEVIKRAGPRDLQI